MKKKKRVQKRKAAFSSGKTYKKRKSGMGKLGSWFPLSTKEHIEDLAAGATSGLISDWVKPLQDKYLTGLFGEYSDEAALAIVGALGHKMLPAGVKGYAKEIYRIGVISAGQGLGRSAFAGLSGNNSTATSGDMIIG